MYYTITEGRARLLDRLNLRDRATYGVDWMVLEGRSARQALHNWQLFQAGTHPRQGELELEAVNYRNHADGCTTPWEAEAEALGLRAAAERAAVRARRQELRAVDAGLRAAERALDDLARVTLAPPSRGSARRTASQAGATRKSSHQTTRTRRPKKAPLRRMEAR
jgi:hypothetical protein